MAKADPASGLRGNTNWRRLWLGQAISLIGDWVFDITVVLWVGTIIAKGESWAPAAVSGVLIAAAAPVLLVGPFAGVFVDRWDRRRTMLIMDLIRAGVIAALILLPLFGAGLPVAVQLACVYGAVLLAGSASQFFNPSRFGAVAAVVGPQDRARAFSLLQATASLATVIGPPLAAPLLFSVGVEWALVINVASFLVSFLAVRAVRLPAAKQEADRPHGGFAAEFGAGLRFFAGNRVLVAMAVATCLYTLGVGALTVLDVFFVTENLKVDAGWLGTLGAAFGVGSVAGALLAGVVADRVGEARVFWLGLTLTGMLILVYSRMTVLPAAIVVIGLAGIPISALGAVGGPLMLRVVPEHMLGRVAAVFGPLQHLASIVSMALAGLLASSLFRDLDADVAGVHFGRIDTLFAFAALLMIGSGLWVRRPLRSLPARQDPVADLDRAPAQSA